MRLSKRARHLLEELAGASSISSCYDRSEYLALIKAGLAEDERVGIREGLGFPYWSYRITTRGLIEIVGDTYQCAECRMWPEWRGKPLELKVERLDGKCTRFLCPNCYATRDA